MDASKPENRPSRNEQKREILSIMCFNTERWSSSSKSLSMYQHHLTGRPPTTQITNDLLHEQIYFTEMNHIGGSRIPSMKMCSLMRLLWWYAWLHPIHLPNNTTYHSRLWTICLLFLLLLTNRFYAAIIILPTESFYSSFTFIFVQGIRGGPAGNTTAWVI